MAQVTKSSDGKSIIPLKEEGKIFQSVSAYDLEVAISDNVRMKYGKESFIGTKIEIDKNGELNILLAFFPNNKTIKQSELVKYGIESADSRNAWTLNDELVNYLIDTGFIGKNGHIQKKMIQNGKRSKSKAIMIVLNAPMTLNAILPKLDNNFEYGIYSVKQIPKTKKIGIMFCTKRVQAKKPENDKKPENKTQE